MVNQQFEKGDVVGLASTHQYLGTVHSKPYNIKGMGKVVDVNTKITRGAYSINELLDFCVSCNNRDRCNRDVKHCSQVVVTVKAGA